MTKRNASERARKREARVLRKTHHAGAGSAAGGGGDVPPPRVGVIMGSRSDWETMRHASEVLDQLGIAHEAAVVSAHRTPDWLFEYAAGARTRGLKVIIAGAGGAAHLPGMCASKTDVPVLGVPVESAVLKGMDSLLSIVQMPAGIPVGTLAIGKAGAINAALLAGAILGLTDATVAGRVAAYRDAQTRTVLRQRDPRRDRGQNPETDGGAEK
jgi:5-(carboxyamino)imidazole ribonucleotide mutase